MKQVAGHFVRVKDLITKGKNFCINLHNLMFKVLSAPMPYSLNSFQPFLSIILLNER